MGHWIRLYTDEHVARVVVEGLRRRGVDVLTCQQAGMLGAADEAHLRLAVDQGRVVLTQDEDFLRLHATGRSHGGLIYCHRQTPIGQLIRGVMLIHEVLEADDMVNHVEFV